MPDDLKIDARTMRGVIPYIGMDGKAGEAADFYARAFAARDLGRMPGEDDPSRLMHCQVEINGGALMMTDMRAPGRAGRRSRRASTCSSSSPTATSGGTARSRPAAPWSCPSRRCSGATAGACSPTPSA